MRILTSLLLGCVLCAPAFGQDEPSALSEQAEGDQRPVLVELFTSQGCGLCPEANRYLGELDQRENVFTLAYAVDYWDMYGWEDTYARPEYRQRQRAYLSPLGVSRLYTPHFVIDGVADAPGWNQDKVSGAVNARLEAMPVEPLIEIDSGPFGSFEVRLSGEAPDASLDVWLVAYAPGWATVEIEAGENEGLDMLHYNMVKSLSLLGRWSGGEADFMGETYRNYGIVAIVQGANGGPVYGWAHLAAPEREAG